MPLPEEVGWEEDLPWKSSPDVELVTGLQSAVPLFLDWNENADCPPREN